MSSTTVDYGTAERPNLDLISKRIIDSIKSYNGFFMFDLGAGSLEGKRPCLELTPDKPYTARTILDFVYTDKKRGDLYVLLFAPGDATKKAGDRERSPTS